MRICIFLALAMTLASAAFAQAPSNVEQYLQGHGVCMACANNIATSYATGKNPGITTLVDAAMKGNPAALKTLTDAKYAVPIDDAAPVKSRTALGRCYLKATADGKAGTAAITACLVEGMEFCNLWGMTVSPSSITLSPVTGRIFMDNSQCADSLQGQYIGARDAFSREYDNYSRYEVSGLPYKPLQFDIREFVRGAK